MAHEETLSLSFLERQNDLELLKVHIARRLGLHLNIVRNYVSNITLCIGHDCFEVDYVIIMGDRSGKLKIGAEGTGIAVTGVQAQVCFGHSSGQPQMRVVCCLFHFVFVIIVGQKVIICQRIESKKRQGAR